MLNKTQVILNISYIKTVTRKRILLDNLHVFCLNEHEICAKDHIICTNR